MILKPKVIKKPRPEYQQPALDKIWEYIHNPMNNGKHPLLSLSVGAGKTLIISWLCQKLKEAYPEIKILVLVHTQELVGQNYEEFKEVAPNLKSALYMSSLGVKKADADIVFGSIQSVSRNPDLFTPHIIIIDECHWISKTQSKGMYRKFIDAKLASHPGTRCIGLTGTEWRIDGGSLYQGDVKLFDDLVYRVPISQLLELGYLCPLITPSSEVRTKFDTSSLTISKSKGDFTDSKLAQILDASQEKTDEAIDEYYRLSIDRNKHLIFGTTVEHLYHIQESASRYFKCRVICGDKKILPQKKREEYIDRFKNPHKWPEEKRLDMLISGVILTTGFNVPAVDSIGLLRDVGSSALYIQIAGRGMRTSHETGKTNCLWVDFTETTNRHGPVDKVEPPPPPDNGKGQAVTKECPSCQAIVAGGIGICPECGHEFEVSVTEIAHDVKASQAKILSTERKPPVWVTLKNNENKPAISWSVGVPYKQRNSEVQTKYLKIKFNSDEESIPIYLTLEGQGRNYACKLWQLLTGDENCPLYAETAYDLLESGAMRQDFNQILLDINDVQTHYTNTKGKRVKNRNGPIGYKLLDLRLR